VIIAMDLDSLSPIYDPHVEPHHSVTWAQRTLFITWLFVLLVWMLRRVRVTSGCCRPWLQRLTSRVRDAGALSIKEDGEGEVMVKLSSDQPIQSQSECTVDVVSVNDEKLAIGDADIKSSSIDGQRQSSIHDQRLTEVEHVVRSTFSPAPSSLACDECMRDIVLLGGIMIFFYMCDYIKVLYFQYSMSPLAEDSVVSMSNFVKKTKYVNIICSLSRNSS